MMLGPKILAKFSDDDLVDLVPMDEFPGLRGKFGRHIYGAVVWELSRRGLWPVPQHLLDAYEKRQTLT